MEHFHCESCNVFINQPDIENHLNGKKHKNKLMQLKRLGATSKNEGDDGPTSKNEGDNGPIKLIIQGYPAYARMIELQVAMNYYGPIDVKEYNKAFAVAWCDDEEIAESIMNENVCIYGKKLTISRYTPKLAKETLQKKQNEAKARQFALSKKKEIIIQPKELDLSGDFEQTSDTILSNIRLTRDEVESISLLYSNVTDLFQCYWPGCMAVPFGSITTGLGIKTSDADCFIDIPPKFRQDPNYNFVQKARALMRRFPHIFAEILAIPSANTPIVKFFHLPTNMSCDVSFKSPLGTHNSKLLAFLLRTDPRILKLCVLIKYWAKIHELTGTGKMSNYALTLSVIFYLQQEPNALLHSVETLQRGRSYFVDGWNTAFIEDYNLLPRLTNGMSLKDLMGGFFKYYKNFKFDEFVICPFLGVPVPRKHFNDLNELSDSFHLYKEFVKVNPEEPLKTKANMIIQDPFTLNRNVASCIGFNLFHQIIQSIEWAANIYEQDKTDSSDNFLRNILLQKPIIKPVPSNTSVKIPLNPFVLKNLSDEHWVNLVGDAVIAVFKDILHFSLTEQTNENESPATSSKKTKTTYLCKAARLVWRNRKVDNSNEDFLAKQIAISKGSLTQHVSMHIIVDVVCSKEKRAHIVIKNENDQDNLFAEFGQFCVKYLGSWFQNLLLKHANAGKIKQSELLKPGKSISVPGGSGESSKVKLDAEMKKEGGENASKPKETLKVKNECDNSNSCSNPPKKIQKTE